MEGGDLSTTIGRATGSAGFDDNGVPIYRNKVMESASEKAKRKANREIKEMAERLSGDQSIIVKKHCLIVTDLIDKYININCVYKELGSAYISQCAQKQAN